MAQWVPHEGGIVSEGQQTRRATFREVLAIREFRALYVAQTLSVAGDQLARIAVAVIVFSRTDSPLLTGLSYAVTYLPWIAGGPALSVLADRLPRRRVMITADLLRACLLCFAAAAHLPSAALIVTVAFVALLEPPFSAARASLVPDVVGEGELYTAASTLGTSTTQLAVVVGFAIGGAATATVGARPTLVVDALTFVASAAIATRYVVNRPAARAARERWSSDVRTAAAVVFGDLRLRWLVVTSWVIVGTAVITEAIAVPYAHAHHDGALAAGLLSAALPLGMVTGAITVARVVPPDLAERLMLPMALFTPAILSLSAFDPPTPVACLIWFLAGVTGSVTILANRLFVIAVPRERRGSAFGLAAAGISGSQGLGTLAVGAVAARVSPGIATADIALVSFGLIVVVSALTLAYRSTPIRPITTGSLTDDEDDAMLAAHRRPEPRVWALNAVLVVIAAAASPLLRGDRAFASVHLPAWWLFALFVLGFAFPLRFEYRQQSWTVYLETVPFVLGLLFVPPLVLLGLRTGAMALNYAIVRQRQLIRSVFNTASYACHTLAAIGVFELIAKSHGSAHPSVWPAVFAAVLVSEFLSSALVALVVGATDQSWELRDRVRSGLIGSAVSIVMAFLALAMAASLDYDLQTAWAITVFVVLSIAGLQTYHRLAERAAALDKLYIIARELGPTTATPVDLAPALMQLRRILRADSLELAAPSSVGAVGDGVSVVLVQDDASVGETTQIFDRPIDEEIASSLTKDSPRRPFSRLWRVRRLANSHQISTLVRSGDRTLGVLTAANPSSAARSFESSDARLLEAAANQLAAALEKGRLVEDLRRAATLDSLTGLANLESLRSFLDTTLEGTAGGVLIVLNLDRFREVNDMLGHEAGDAVLAEVARRLQSAPAQGALFARVGGDQFAIAIPGAAGSEVARLAGMAVKSRVDGSLRLAEVSADIRVTIGIARAPDHGSDSATLLRRAEMAMAAAKGGSSGIGEWNSEYERHGSRRLHLLTGLRSALGDGSLQVEYQPKLRLGSGEVTGFEALVRWTHPELGPVSPNEFVPLAEATGLVSALTSTVLRQSLAACRTWHDAGKPVGVAVNVSARSLDDNVLVGQVAAMLTASGLDPRWLTLEITESSVMEDQSRSLDVLRDLRGLGVRLSIDDFGTGYSSLHQLRGLPVNEVKIDRSFIETVDKDEADRAVVRAVVELCDSLGLVTVAEGVEKAAQAYALDTLGVDQVQGYFHGRPMDYTEVVEWLTSRRIASLAVASN